MADRVLALSLRPKSFTDLIGQEDVIKSLNSQLHSGRIPHFFLISGVFGSGKTTLARIIAVWLQTKSENLLDAHSKNYKNYEISEINAANQTGVEDMRRVIESMKYHPLPPSKAKVVILDEAHQLSNAAQNAMITETEDVADHVYYIFCTSAINKIIPALKRRAFIVHPKALSKSAIDELVTSAEEAANYQSDTESLRDALKNSDVTSPGLVLQATEKFFTGVTAEESVLMLEASKFDTSHECEP